jgi:hypothetical protein
MTMNPYEACQESPIGSRDPQSHTRRRCRRTSISFARFMPAGVVVLQLGRAGASGDRVCSGRWARPRALDGRRGPAGRMARLPERMGVARWALHVDARDTSDRLRRRAIQTTKGDSRAGVRRDQAQSTHQPVPPTRQIRHTLRMATDHRHPQPIEASQAPDSPRSDLKDGPGGHRAVGQHLRPQERRPQTGPSNATSLAPPWPRGFARHPRRQGGAEVDDAITPASPMGKRSSAELQSARSRIVLSEHVGAAGEKRRIHAEARV